MLWGGGQLWPRLRIIWRGTAWICQSIHYMGPAQTSKQHSHYLTNSQLSSLLQSLIWLQTKNLLHWFLITFNNCHPKKSKVGAVCQPIAGLLPILSNKTKLFFYLFVLFVVKSIHGCIQDCFDWNTDDKYIPLGGGTASIWVITYCQSHGNAFGIALTAH